MRFPSCVSGAPMAILSTKHISRLSTPSRHLYCILPRRAGHNSRQFSISAHSKGKSVGRWTESDTALLLKLREHDQVKWAKVGEAFPGRTLDSLRAHYTRISETTRTKTLWTDEEHAKLLELKADGKSWREIVAAFPGRSISALYTRWTRTQGGSTRKYTKWTPEEDERLLALKKSGEFIRQYAKLFPDRTIAAINRRYTSIGPRGKYGRLVFTGYKGFENEDREKIFNLNQNGMTPTQIHAEHFPDQSIESVRNVIRLGRRGDELPDARRYRQRWSRTDDKTILRMRQKEHRTFKDISIEIGRSYLSTTNRYYKLTEGTIRPHIPHPKEYTSEERAKIAQMLKAKTPIREIAAAVGRTRIAIAHHMFSNRAEMGYVAQPGKSWRERTMVARKVEKLRKQGLQWKAIQTIFPTYSTPQLKEYYNDLHNGVLESNYAKERTPLPEKELQELANRVRRLKLRGLSWTEIGLRFQKYSLNRLRSLYIEANKGVDKKFTVGRPPTKGRPRSEVDVEKIGEYRANELTWKEIQAHMPDWSEATLQRAYGERAPRLKPLGKVEVRKIARLKATMTWSEVQAHMPEFGESRLRRAFAEARKEAII